MGRRIELSIHGKLYFVLVIFVGMNLSIAAITSDLKLTHMSFTDIRIFLSRVRNLYHMFKTLVGQCRIYLRAKCMLKIYD